MLSNLRRVLKVKYHGWFKTKLVALGWKQKDSIDCAISLAPVCRLDNQRLLVAIVASRDGKFISPDAQTG